MAMIKCPECGKDVSDRAPSCPNCGCPINTSATPAAPQVDAKAEAEKYLVLARRAKEDGNSENAAKYFGLATQANPFDWEAAFYQVYYQAMSCKIMNIASAATSVANSISSTFSLVKELNDPTKEKTAISAIVTDSAVIANMLASAANNHYTQHSTVNNAFSEFVNRAVSAGGIFQSLEKELKTLYPEEKDTILSVQKYYINFLKNFSKAYNATFRTNETNRLAEEIKVVDPTFVAPQPPAQSGGCYVATAVYGSYNCPEVWTLRRFRDNTLAKTWYGRTFIHVYYAVSPTLVKWFGETEWFKNMWKPTLDKMVTKLNNEGVESTPYNDRNW